jgi:hypothetical protein
VKKAYFIFAGIGLLMFATSAAWAVTAITISDLGEGTPTVTPYPIPNADITSGYWNNSTERAWLTDTDGSAYLAGGGLPTNLKSAVFLTNAGETDGIAWNGTYVSDILTFQTTNEFSFAIDFKSDGASGFTNTYNDIVDTSGNPKSGWTVVSIDEDGTMQNLTGLLGGLNSKMTVSVKSDFTVPIPGAVWFLGSGLLGLAGLRRFRKS